MKKILTVDDAITMRKLVSVTLSNEGYKVFEAQDGAAALLLAGREKFDLFLVDVNMPGMNGLEFVERIRKMDNFIKTPILMLTTETDPKAKNRAKAAGATGWIMKPFKQSQLIAVVNKIFSR